MTKEIDETISRIAGRMVHRANDITGTESVGGYLNGIKSRIAELKRRDPTKDSAVGEKIADLEERRDQLMRAEADYRKAEKIIRAFPFVISALYQVTTAAQQNWTGELLNVALENARAAVAEAQEAIK